MATSNAAPPKSTPAADNRSRQLNPEHPAYHQSRGTPPTPTATSETNGDEAPLPAIEKK